MNEKYSWIRDIFHEISPPNNDFLLEEEENYIDLTSDTSLKLRFRRESLTEFWVGVGEEYPHLGKKAIVTVLSPIFGCPTWSQVFENGPKECGIVNWALE
jgi:hypothetical protein